MKLLSWPGSFRSEDDSFRRGEVDFDVLERTEASAMFQLNSAFSHNSFLTRSAEIICINDTFNLDLRYPVLVIDKSPIQHKLELSNYIQQYYSLIMCITVIEQLFGFYSTELTLFHIEEDFKDLDSAFVPIKIRMRNKTYYVYKYSSGNKVIFKPESDLPDLTFDERILLIITCLNASADLLLNYINEILDEDL